MKKLIALVIALSATSVMADNHGNFSPAPVKAPAHAVGAVSCTAAGLQSFHGQPSSMLVVGYGHTVAQAKANAMSRCQGSMSACRIVSCK